MARKQQNHSARRIGQHQHLASGTIGKKALFLGAAVAVLLAYFGFVRPARHHVALLQRQCDQLAATVSKLDSRIKVSGRSLHLIDVLDQQNSKIAGAETALREYVDLRRRLADETRHIAAAVGALDQLEQVRDQVIDHHRTLASASDVLGQMNRVATSLNTSRDMAQQAEAALQKLDQSQTSLVGGLARITGSFPALEPVVEKVQQLCDRLADSEGLVNHATIVSQRQASLQGQLLRTSETLPKAEKAFTQMGSICTQLGEQAATIEVAQRQLADMNQLKSKLLAQTRDLPDAAAVLTQLVELRDGLLRSSGTLGEIQHLVVDMVLLEPAVKRAMLAFKPVVEITRLSSQIESPRINAMKTAEDGMGDASTTGENATTSADSPQESSWSEMIEEAVAWCQKTLK
jgi:DNA repair exonuclease SbcCD ATPase subunit